MASDFAVLFDDRFHFGSHPGYFDDATIFPPERLGPEVTFVGADKSILFETPNLDSSQAAVLMYQSFDITTPRNVIEINDAKIVGGIPVDTSRCEWKSNFSVISPGCLIKNGTNKLYVEARKESGDTESNPDNFVLTNAVIFYKTLD